MGNFNRGGERSGGGFGRGGFGGRKSFGGGSRFGGDRDRAPREMHSATCGECGADCEVPFRPTGDRPVLCSACFGRQNGDEGGRSNRFSDRRERPRFEDKQMFDATCGECGSECQVPFRPTAGKPVLCSDCFKKGGNGGKDNSKEIMEQFKSLNYKMDKLIKLLTPAGAEEKKEEPKKAKKEKVEIAPVVETEVLTEKKEKKAKKKATKKTE